MKAKLERTGDVFTLAVPAKIVEAVGLGGDGEVSVHSESGRIVIRRRVDLDNLLDQINGPPPPGEWDDIQPKGSDVW